jgi:hypothetical protein
MNALIAFGGSKQTDKKSPLFQQQFCISPSIESLSADLHGYINIDAPTKAVLLFMH